MLQHFRYKIGFGFECSAEISNIEKIKYQLQAEPVETTR